jgi:hypothetical protein
VPRFQFHRHTSHQSSFTSKVSLNQTYTRHTFLFLGVQFVFSLVWYLRFLIELFFQYTFFDNVKSRGEYKNVSMKKVSPSSLQRIFRNVSSIFIPICPCIVNQFLKMFQIDDTFLCSILFPANGSTCFEWNIHPSSGARINCSYSIW